MTTFLNLCKRLRQEAGIAGTGPTSVASQTGEMKRLVDWILSAYEDVQNKHRVWEFLRNEFAVQTVAGTSAYSLSTLSLTELAAWKRDSFRCYLTASGTVDEQWLTCCKWDSFRDRFLFGANRDVSSRPTHFAIKPDKSLVLWPKPDAVYTIGGEYFKRAQTMTADDDEPLFPEEFHLVLVWRALMLYGGEVGAPEAYARGEEEYKKLLGPLQADQLPEIEIGGALA